MPVLIGNEGKSAVPAGGGHGLRHIVQKQIRPGHRHQLIPPVDGQRAHDADLTGKHILDHVRVKQFSRFRGAPVPRPFPNADRNLYAVFIKLGGGMVVRQQHHAVRQRHIAGADVGVGIQRLHHIRHIGNQPQLFRNNRILGIDPGFRQQLDGDGSLR